MKSQEQLDKMSNRELRHYIMDELKIMGIVSKAKNREELYAIIGNSTQVPSVLIPCSIQIDSGNPVMFQYPAGKTKKDLLTHIYNFFQS
jgi:hypothetical protein